MAPAQSKRGAARKRTAARGRAPKTQPVCPIPASHIPSPTPPSATVLDDNLPLAIPAPADHSPVPMTLSDDDEIEDAMPHGAGGLSAARGGRPAGASTYTTGELKILLDTIAGVLPRGQNAWEEVRKIYNEEVSQGRQRETHNLRVKFNRLLKMKKPTGTGEADPLHVRALEIEDMMHNQEETAALDDTWSSSESELPSFPPPAYTPLPPRPVTSVPRPLPPPFTSSKGKERAVYPKPLTFKLPAPKPCLPPPTPLEEVIEIDSDSDHGPAPHESKVTKPRPKRKAEIEPGLHVRKAPATAPTPTKLTASRASKSAALPMDSTADRLVGYLDPEIDRAAADKRHMDDIVRMMLFDKDRTIESLRREVNEEKERRHQVERQLDQLNLVLTLRGVTVPVGGTRPTIPVTGMPMADASIAAQPTPPSAHLSTGRNIVLTEGHPSGVPAPRQLLSPLVERDDASGSGLRPEEK